MWWNTLALRGAVTTPTKLDRLDSSCAALAITRCGWSGCSCASIAARATLASVERLRREHGVDEQPVAARRGDAAGAGVRAGDQAELFQVGHHVADRRRRQLEAARRATACASRPAGRRRCSARPAPSAGSWRARPAWCPIVGRAGRLPPACAAGRCGVIPRMADTLPSRRARGQVPGPGIRDVLEEIAAVPGRARASRSRSSARPRSNTGIDRLRRARPPTSSASSCDLAVVVGGDGTMLGIARQLAPLRHCRWSASTRAGSASSPTSPIGQFAEALAPMLAGDYEEEQPHACSKAACWRDGETHLRGLRDERRGREPRRHRRHGRAARSTSATSSSPTSAPTA